MLAGLFDPAEHAEEGSRGATGCWPCADSRGLRGSAAMFATDVGSTSADTGQVEGQGPDADHSVGGGQVETWWARAATCRFRLGLPSGLGLGLASGFD